MKATLGNHSDREAAVARDTELLQDFTKRLQRPKSGQLTPLIEAFLNQPEISQFEKIEKFLIDRQTLDIATEELEWRDSDDEFQMVTITRAAKTRMWPMGTNYWVKDNAMIAYALLQASQAGLKRSAEYGALGKKLLLSTLTLMASVAQLKRFEEVITHPDPAIWDSQSRWPHIFLEIDDNLIVSRTTGWSHKQIAWQALACRTLELIESELLSREELTAKHKAFLGMIVPFLQKVRFWEHENSSCWEEITARRSSALAWDTAVIRKIAASSQKSGFEFLQAGWEHYKQYVGTEASDVNLQDATQRLLDQGYRALQAQLPFEAPGYPKDNPRYREADSLLLYLLMTNTPNVSEPEILAQVHRLQDSLTGAFFRYENDTYQRQGYFRNVTVYDIKKLIGAPSGDASAELHFVGRRKIIASGRQAAWVHPVWQLSWLMGKRFQATGNASYFEKQKHFFIQGLHLITKEDEVSLEQGEDEAMRVIDIPPYRITEAYLTDKDASGKELISPSPHTPLNWAAGEAIHALAMMEKSLELRVA